MKRDMDLVRQILLVVEEHGTEQGHITFEPSDTPGKTPDEVAGHIRLLHEHGFIEAEDGSGFGNPVWFPQRLTWQGHEFLDAIRNDTIWARTKRVIADKGGSMPFELVRELVMVVAREYFLNNGGT